MFITQNQLKSNRLYKILSILKREFSDLFKVNTFGRPRKYSPGKILALMIYYSENSNLTFRKISKTLKNDLVSLKILEFEKTPDHTIIFKTYTKFLKLNMNLFLMTIAKKINKSNTEFYLDSSSLVSSITDKLAKFGKSTRIGWYKGYKVHLICNTEGIPITYDITTANVHDVHCKKLLNNLKKMVSKAEIIADKGYDSTRLLNYAHDLDIDIIAPINKRNSKKIEVKNIKNILRQNNYLYLISEIGKKRYKKRWEIERLFGNLKENYGIDNHRIRGINQKKMDIGLKLLLFTIKQVIAVLKIIQYFCNDLKYI